MTMSRITIIETVYHQSSETIETTSLNNQFEIVLKTDEQPYARTTKINEEWKPLDKGWLENHPTSLVVIVNEEGKFPQRILTTGEKEEIALRVIELGLRGSNDQFMKFAIIKPGQSIRFNPHSLEQLYIRCAVSIGAKISLTVYPG